MKIFSKLLPFNQPFEKPFKIYQIVWILIYPLFLSLMIEWLSRLQLIELFNWVINNPLNFYLNYLVILMLFFFFYGLSNRLWIASLLCSSPLLILTFMSFFKASIRGEPLLPWDLFLSKEALGILSKVSIDFTSAHIIFIFTFFLAIVILFLFQKKELKLNIYGRVSAIFIALISLISLYNGVFFNESALESLNIVDYFWNQEQNYSENGFLTAFSINIKNILIQKPDNYSLTALEEIIDNFSNPAIQTLSFEEKTIESKEKPNIIFIMNESLFDPTVLPNVSFSTNPISNIEKIRLEGSSGKLLVSEFGGGTANTEFEVLTGNKTLYLPKGSMVYQQYLKTPIPAIPAYLKEQGYNTVAIHPYQKWFWDRDKVYPNLGFDVFYSDEDFVNPEKLSNLISDRSASERVIEEFERNGDTNSPFFCFLVTMQNHGAYDSKEFSSYDINTESSLLDEKSNSLLENYIQGVYDADAAYGMLVDYFKNIDQPTIIVMFGDHLPTLGNNYQIYKDLGYIESETLADVDYLNLFNTPITLYSNDNSIAPQDLGLIDANLLGITLLDKLGFELPTYWQILLNGQEIFNQNNYITIDNEGNIGPTLESEALNEKQWLFEYDLLFGEGYLNPYLP